jgi:hypothetical protein
VEPPTAETAAFCQVVPDFVLGRPGMRVRFDIHVRDASGKPLVPADGITWTAANETMTGDGAGTSAIFTLPPPGDATEEVEARVGNTTCRALVRVLPMNVPQGEVRVVVTDELTGRPLRGALVTASNKEGNITGSSETANDGTALVPATGEVSLTVFHEAYNYLTLAHYDTERGSRDVWLPLRRNPLDLHGGSRGTFVNVPKSEKILLGISGLSLPAMGLNVYDRQYAGLPVPVTVPILGKEYTLDLSSNAYISLPSQVLKAEYSAPGVAGVCDADFTGNLDPEEAIRSSTCGTRTGWAIAGELPLNNIKFIDRDVHPDLEVFQMMLQDPTVLKHFYSSVVRDVQFQLKPVPPSGNSNDPVYGNTTHYTQADHDFQQLPLGFVFDVDVPTTPRYRDLPLNRIIILGTAIMAGQGMVPLGLGSTSVKDGPEASVRVRVYTAPAHHGLEGSPYKLLVASCNEWGMYTYAQDVACSILVTPLEGRPLSPVTLSSNFLPLPNKARFNFNAMSDERLQGREFRFFTAPGLQGATMLRVLFTNGLRRQWMVLMDPKRATTGFRLPIPPRPYPDRTRFDSESDKQAWMAVQAISARKTDGSELDLMSLVEAEDINLSRLSDFISAISTGSYGKPDVWWIAPGPDVGSIRRTDKVRVSITDFHINDDPADDGHVRLSFQGGTGCADTMLYDDDDTDLHEFIAEFSIPSSCWGNQVQMTITLVDSHKVPLSPPVFSTRIVTIN